MSGPPERPKPIGPGNHERAWNDPPLFSVEANTRSTGLGARKLSKRVAFPLNGPTPTTGTTFQGGPSNLPPMMGLPPPPIPNNTVPNGPGYLGGFPPPTIQQTPSSAAPSLLLQTMIQGPAIVQQGLTRQEEGLPPGVGPSPASGDSFVHPPAMHNGELFYPSQTI